MEIKLSEFVSAGFFITREVERPSYVEADLFPTRILSACNCIATFAPDEWCIEWMEITRERRLEDAQTFGLKSNVLDEITQWVTQRFNKSLLWPNIICDLDTAREFVDRFLSSSPDIRMFEMGLHQSLVDPFCKVAEPPPQKSGLARKGCAGVYDLILRSNRMTPGGVMLGFEPLVFDFDLGHSWLCNSLDAVINQALGISPNRHGFIGTLGEALDCVKHISRDDVGAEPGLWLPWLLIDHTEAIIDCGTRESNSKRTTIPSGVQRQLNRR
jgi:hypothetical protein